MGLIKFAKIVYEEPEAPEEFKEYLEKSKPLEGKGKLDVFGITLTPDIPNDIMFLGREKDIPKVINKYYPNSIYTTHKHQITDKTLIYKNKKIIFDIDDNYEIKFK